MSRQPAILALTVPSTTKQSHDLISPEKTMPRPTTSLRIAVCAASAAFAAAWLGVIGAVAGEPNGLKVLFIIPLPLMGTVVENAPHYSFRARASGANLVCRR